MAALRGRTLSYWGSNTELPHSNGRGPGRIYRNSAADCGSRFAGNVVLNPQLLRINFTSAIHVTYALTHPFLSRPRRASGALGALQDRKGNGPGPSAPQASGLGFRGVLGHAGPGRGSSLGPSGGWKEKAPNTQATGGLRGPSDSPGSLSLTLPPLASGGPTELLGTSISDAVTKIGSGSVTLLMQKYPQLLQNTTFFFHFLRRVHL